MLKKIVLGVAVVALVVALTPTASASCAVLKTASTYNSSTGSYVYWTTSIPGPAGPAPQLTGQTWQLGSYGTWNDRLSGTSPACGGNLYFNASAEIGMQLALNTCGTGCPAPAASLAYLAMNRGPGHTEFLLVARPEGGSAGLNWDYSLLGAQTMIPIPRPRVVSSSRSGATLNMQVGVDAAAGGAFGTGAAGAITGYRVLVSAQGNTDPGRAPASYNGTPLLSFAVTAGAAAPAAPTSVDCTDGTKSYWLTTQLVLEGGAVFSDAVSGATRVSCGPGNLADPKFKIIDKKPARDRKSVV